MVEKMIILFTGECVKKPVLPTTVMIQLLTYQREMIKCVSSVLKDSIKLENLSVMATLAVGEKTAV